MLDGEKLKFLRYMHGKTQKQVAEWCDLNIRTIKGVEANEYGLSDETYQAWLNCIYDIGEPLKRDKPTQEKKEEKTKSPSKRRTTRKTE